MPPARTSKSAGTRPASSPAPSSTPRSPPWFWATATSISYDQLVAAHHRRQSRQVAPLHRLDAAAAERGAARLRHLRRDPSARRLSQALRRSRQARAQRLDARGDEGPHLARHLSVRARARLGTPEDTGAQAQGARRADRGRGLARARGAGARRAARPRAQGRRRSATSRFRRRRRSSGSETCGRCPGASSARDGARRSSPRSSAGLRAIRRRCRGSTGRSPRSTARPPWSCSRCCCA